MEYSKSKRFFDLFSASVLLLLTLPFIILLSVLIRILLGKPILFKQQRPGLNEKPFYLFKFRTMLDIKNKDGELLSDQQRLTNFGKFLRSTSLDELPELINVIKGDMSFVGPRPLLMDYLPYYSEDQRIRHDVKPGITGWAQINGRNTLSWEKKFELDIWYVNHRSFFLDLRIILITIIKTIKREGINAKGQATMSRFDSEVKKHINM